MTDTEARRLRIDIARDLRDIGQLHAQLSGEALEHADDPELPGGEAMNLLGPAASMSAWTEQLDALEEAEVDTSYANDQVAERHVLLVLGDWEERVRHELSQPTGLRATVPRALDYLRDKLDWIAEHFNDAPAMARELHQVRVMLENVLSEGVRFDTSAAACFKDIADEDGQPVVCGGQLVRRTLERRDCEHVARAIDMAKGVADPVTVLRQTLLAFPEDELAHRSCDQGGRDDVYRCQQCNGFYTEAEYWLAVKQHYEQEAAG